MLLYLVKMMKRYEKNMMNVWRMIAVHREKTHLQSWMIFVSTACHAPNIDLETSMTGHLDRHGPCPAHLKGSDVHLPRRIWTSAAPERIPKDETQRYLFNSLDSFRSFISLIWGWLLQSVSTLIRFYVLPIGVSPVPRCKKSIPGWSKRLSVLNPPRPWKVTHGPWQIHQTMLSCKLSKKGRAKHTNCPMFSPNGQSSSWKCLI